ncbi:hypothetical protein OH786_29725 [Streptomyces atratus]|uniref:Uncharacterized protein n=1 Tax=Streptomyces atratus TaxID=1893 RepID=A0A1K1Z921_STRAR|nr:hypothetical protein [Streptomyces atratus]SFX70576.1 hypothetical protein SAMN02787144_1005229 [Streptomyces atratus]
MRWDDPAENPATTGNSGAARRLPVRKGQRAPLDGPGPTQLTLL